jgi:lysine decarboxylase
MSDLPGEGPLAEVLAAMANRAPRLALHLPAHGRGRALAPALVRLLRRAPGCWDLPELPELGGPLEPSGAVAEAQRRAARLLGADRCWFGVNGASGLLQAALLGICPPGSRLLLPRNLHRSLLHACVLGDLRPVLFTPPFDPATGLWQPPSPDRMRQVLAQALRAGPLAAVVLVDPTYQGFGADLEGLISVVHDHSGSRSDGLGGPPVLVDQAHGTGAALAAGADAAVLSFQKAGTGLAQSAALLIRGPRIDALAMERALLWLQTSSPSALLLASAAAAVDHAHSAAGERQLQRAEARAATLRQRILADGLPLMANDDPLRLVLATAPLGISGLEADAWLMCRGVVAELPEPGALTFALGLAPPRALERLLPQRLRELRAALGKEALAPFTAPPVPLVATTELPVGTAWRAPSESVSLAAAAGRIAAEPICPYPPGIPMLVPGERIDPPRAAWLVAERSRWPGQIADTVRVVAGT